MSQFERVSEEVHRWGSFWSMVLVILTVIILLLPWSTSRGVQKPGDYGLGKHVDSLGGAVWTQMDLIKINIWLIFTRCAEFANSGAELIPSYCNIALIHHDPESATVRARSMIISASFFLIWNKLILLCTYTIQSSQHYHMMSSVFHHICQFRTVCSRSIFYPACLKLRGPLGSKFCEANEKLKL